MCEEEKTKNPETLPALDANLLGVATGRLKINAQNGETNGGYLRREALWKRFIFIRRFVCVQLAGEEEIDLIALISGILIGSVMVVIRKKSCFD